MYGAQFSQTSYEDADFYTKREFWSGVGMVIFVMMILAGLVRYESGAPSKDMLDYEIGNFSASSAMDFLSRSPKLNMTKIEELLAELNRTLEASNMTQSPRFHHHEPQLPSTDHVLMPSSGG